MMNIEDRTSNLEVLDRMFISLKCSLGIVSEIK
jgi:hypothetical protein